MLDVGGVLVWLKGVGIAALAIVIICGGLKLAGFDFLWSMLSKFVDWTISAFNALVFSAPTPIRVGIFLILFSILGAVLIPISLGVYGLCDSHNDIWVTDSYFEGLAGSLIPAGSQFKGDVGFITVDNIVGSLLTSGGPLVDSTDTISVNGVDKTAVVTPGDTYIASGQSSSYFICYDTENNICVVQRPSRVARNDEYTSADCAIGPGESVNKYQTLASFYYDFKDDSGERAVGDVKSRDYGISLDHINYYYPAGKDSINACPQKTTRGDEMLLQVNTTDTTTATSSFFDFFTNLIDNQQIALGSKQFSGYVVGARGDVVALSTDLNQAKALSLKDSFVTRQGSGYKQVSLEGQSTLIQYSCTNGDKNVTLYGVPVFDPWVMLILIFIMIFAYLIFR